MAIDLPPTQPWQGECYRNVSTCHPSQDLYDDLNLDDHEKDIIMHWENKSSDIDHTLQQKNRVFQYGAIGNSMAVFEQSSWQPGRFNTLDFGVWYGSLEAQTSEIESLYWFYQLEKDNITVAHGDIHRDRKMFKAQIEAQQCIDFRQSDAQTLAKLTDKQDYTHTHGLGQKAHAAGIDMFMTPSARNPEGICTPVFKPCVIVDDQVMYYLRFTLRKTGELFKTKIGVPEKVSLLSQALQV